VHQAKDNEELLSFLLGQLVKEKVQLYRHGRGENPASVQVRIGQLEARAKELEIYDVGPFVKGRLFRANGYKVVGEGADRAVEKVFTRVGAGDEL
jgi:DNA replication licensing factor MCM2